MMAADSPLVQFVAEFKTILFDPMDKNKVSALPIARSACVLCSVFAARLCGDLVPSPSLPPTYTQDGVVSLAELREYYLKIQVKTDQDLTEADKQMFADFFAQRDEDGDGKISWREMWRAERTRQGSLVQTVLKTQKQREEREAVIEEAKLRRQSAKAALKMCLQKRPEEEKEDVEERAKQAFLQKHRRWQAWDEFDAFEDEDALKNIFNEHIESPQQLANLMYCVYMNLFNIEGAMKSESLGLLHR